MSFLSLSQSAAQLTRAKTRSPLLPSCSCLPEAKIQRQSDTSSIRKSNSDFRGRTPTRCGEEHRSGKRIAVITVHIQWEIMARSSLSCVFPYLFSSTISNQHSRNHAPRFSSFTLGANFSVSYPKQNHAKSEY